MKQLVLIYLSFLICGKVNAQVKPVYFYGDRVTSNKYKATSYAIYGKLSDKDLWMFKRFDLYDNLLQVGSYNDEMLSIPHGKFTFYTSVEDFNRINKTHYSLKGQNRFVSQEGEFVNGKEEGRWFAYYPDGNILSHQEYKAGIMEGEYKEFDKYGDVTIAGNFSKNEKHGEWISEKGTRIDTYEYGVLKSTRYVKKTKRIKGEVKN